MGILQHMQFHHLPLKKNLNLICTGYVHLTHYPHLLFKQVIYKCCFSVRELVVYNQQRRESVLIGRGENLYQSSQVGICTDPQKRESVPISRERICADQQRRESVLISRRENLYRSAKERICTGFFCFFLFQ